MKLQSWTAMGIAALVLTLLTLFSAADNVNAGTFNPTIATVVEDPTGGANSNFTTQFEVPAGDVNFGAAVFFIPNEWGITPGTDVPLGAVVGELEAQATLGLINAQCDNILTVQFKMLNGSVDITDTVEFEDTDDNGDGDVFEDKDESGLQDGIEKWPAFINRITDNAQPVRRAVGVEIVAGVDVLLQFVVFEPGTTITSEIPSDEERGYPTVTFLQALGDPDIKPEPGAITDFCSPLTSTNVTFGVSKDNPCTADVPADELDSLCAVKSAPLEIPDEGVSEPDESGVALYTNPGAGTYNFSAIAFGQRDADDDGYENSFDTCPFDANQGNPRSKGDGDFDEDGMDTACDPNDDDPNSDQDLDGYLNRQDNCPLVPNGEDDDNQHESDVNDDGDNRPDAIGDACDPDPQKPNGEPPSVELSSEVTIEGGTEPGPTPTTDDEDDGGGLSSGAVAAIVVGVIVGVAVIAGAAYVLMRRGGGGSAA